MHWGDMVEIGVRDLAEVVEGTLVASEADARRVVTGVALDSREVVDGAVFFAFVGEHADGNDFCAAAVEAGAGAVVTTREPSSSLRALAGEFVCPLVVADDAQAALRALAGWWRARLRCVVVGVTGSVGKTTTKDLVAGVLARRYKTHATSGNHNNEIGVPLTILSAPLDTEALVVEMGMRGEGQIASLAELAHPGIGVVTKIGSSHIELLGSREAIARAKGELLASLTPRGTAVVNADDEMTPALLDGAHIADGVRVLRFGLGEGVGDTGDAGSAGDAGGAGAPPDVTARGITFDETACAAFTLEVSGVGSADVTLAVPGLHAVTDALAASAVGVALGLDVTDIAIGLAQVRPAGMRMEVLAAPGGAKIVNDAYNANPESMSAALDTLADMTCSSRRIAVLGDMGELGGLSEELHAGIGERAAQLCAAGRLDALVCVGTLASHIAEGARCGGMPDGAVRFFDTAEEALSHLTGELACGPGDVVLVKASRFMALERIVEGLVR